MNEMVTVVVSLIGIVFCFFLLYQHFKEEDFDQDATQELGDDYGILPRIQVPRRDNNQIRHEVHGSFEFKISYRDPGGTLSKRVIKLYNFRQLRSGGTSFFENHVAETYCYLRNAPRQFRLDRIQSVAGQDKKQKTVEEWLSQDFHVNVSNELAPFGVNSGAQALTQIRLPDIGTKHTATRNAREHLGRKLGLEIQSDASRQAVQFGFRSLQYISGLEDSATWHLRAKYPDRVVLGMIFSEMCKDDDIVEALIKWGKGKGRDWDEPPSLRKSNDLYIRVFTLGAHLR